jgi:Flp pilus assembly protein TadG
MTTLRLPRSSGSRSGQSLLEFAVVGFMLGILLFAVVEIGRAVLVYVTTASAARIGARYAMLHGSSRTGSGADGPSGPGSNPAQVISIVQNVAAAGLLTPANLDITVSYPDSSNAPGSRVSVTVIYPYNALTTFIPWTMRLGSTTQEVIRV